LTTIGPNNVYCPRNSTQISQIIVANLLWKQRELLYRDLTTSRQPRQHWPLTKLY